MKSKKTLVAASVVAAGLAVGVPATVSYFLDADKAVNTFTIGHNKTTITERFPPPGDVEPGDVKPKDVKITNEGSVPCYVRVMAVPSISDVDATMNYDTTRWVYNNGDGYWYYKQALPVGATTPSLFTQITFGQDADEEALKSFDVIVYAESCQCEGEATYYSHWTDSLT